MNREEKTNEIDLISSAIGNAAVALCVDYRGLNVSQVTSLRRKLREKKAHGRVVKNTLLRIASEKSLKGDAGQLKKFVALHEGPTLLVWSDDPVSSAKVLVDFAKESQKLNIKGAWVDGIFVDGKGVGDLSRLPGKEATLSMLLNLMLAPATQFVRLINAPGTQLAQVLEAYRQKLAEAA